MCIMASEKKIEGESRRTYNVERAVKPVKVSGAILIMPLRDKYLYCMHKSWANQHKCAPWRWKEREKEREREREREKKERKSRRTYKYERAVKPVKVPGAILIMLLLNKPLCCMYKSWTINTNVHHGDGKRERKREKEKERERERKKRGRAEELTILKEPLSQ